MSAVDSAAWGMGFELFTRLVAALAAAAEHDEPGAELADETLEEAARTARRALRIWHSSKALEEPR